VPDLTMVIPAYVTGTRIMPMLPRILEGFREPGVELVIVDNGGDPEASPMLEDAADVYVRFSENQGYPKGVNAGLQHAHSDVVGIGSIDILVPDGWAKVMLRTSELVTSANEDETESMHRRARGPFWGAWFTFPRKALDVVGVMDPEYAGWADRDFGLRLAEAGFGFTRAPLTVGHVAPNHAHRELRRDAAYAAEWEAATWKAYREWGATEFMKAVAGFRPDLTER